MMSSQILWQFKKGDKIAQLLILPYISINSSNVIQTDRLSNTIQKQSLWTSLLSEYAWPNINIKINGKRFSGFLNSVSDITLIQTFMAQILAYTKNLLPNYRNFSNESTRSLSKCSDLSMWGTRGQPTTLRTYVIDTPITLIRRDLLIQWQTQIYIPHVSQGPLLI